MTNEQQFIFIRSPVKDKPEQRANIESLTQEIGTVMGDILSTAREKGWVSLSFKKANGVSGDLNVTVHSNASQLLNLFVDWAKAQEQHAPSKYKSRIHQLGTMESLDATMLGLTMSAIASCARNIDINTRNSTVGRRAQVLAAKQLGLFEPKAP